MCCDALSHPLYLLIKGLSIMRVTVGGLQGLETREVVKEPWERLVGRGARVVVNR